MNNQKTILKPSGKPLGHTIGGGDAFYSLTGSIGMYRDDFGSIDADEWTETAGSTVSQDVTVSAGWALVVVGTGSTGIQTFTTKKTFRVPFRVVAAIGIDGINTGMEAIMRVRHATAGYSDAAPLAEWVFTGSAGGTEHTAQVRIRAGSSAAGYIASAAPSAPSAITGISGSAGHLYTIDFDMRGVSFALSSAGVSTTLMLTTSGIHATPYVHGYAANPLPAINKPFVLEFILRSGTAITDGGAASNTAGTDSAAMRIDYLEVMQYVPAASLQRPGPFVSYVVNTPHSTGATVVAGATATIAAIPYMKWS